MSRLPRPPVGTPGIVGKDNPDIYGDGELIEKNQFKSGFMRYLWHPNAKDSVSRHEKDYLAAFLLASTLKCADFLGKRIGTSPYVRACWLVSQEAGDYSVFHTHIPATLSGVLYLQCPPSINANTFPDGILALVEGKNVVAAPPIPGLMLVWPGSIPHLVYPFRGGGRRVLISWNLHISRTNKQVPI